MNKDKYIEFLKAKLKLNNTQQNDKELKFNQSQPISSSYLCKPNDENDELFNRYQDLNRFQHLFQFNQTPTVKKS